ncbi:MAG: aldo/keto reductase [Rhodospirillaceae bacterium]|nr:MAG: aldo/keto reductase [Rhodospirillaceae bacterium]
MEQRALGRSGLKVSAVGLGCNSFGDYIDAAATQTVVDKAIDLGITLFDTANAYGQGKSEELLGRALGTHRQQVLVATKFGLPMGNTPHLQAGGSRDAIMRAVESSLRRLGTDYIDLYQIHGPDASTPIAETLRALDDLVRQGKVRYIGHSNFSGWEVADAAWTADVNTLVPFISAQNRYSVITRTIESDVVPACQKHGVGIIPYFPLESGLLTGKYKYGEELPTGSRINTLKKKAPAAVERYFGDAKFKLADTLQKWCATKGYPILGVALGWLLAKPYVSSVIAGATKPEQLETNVKAAAWRPTAEDIAEIDALSPPPPVTSGR